MSPYVSLDSLEQLLGRAFDSAKDCKHGLTSERLSLCVEYQWPSVHGLVIGIRAGCSPMMTLGRIQDFSAKASANGSAHEHSFCVTTRSRECADILSLFYPLTQTTYEPTSFTEDNYSTWGPLLVKGTEYKWEVHPDYDVLGIRGQHSPVLAIQNLKTKGVIEVTITAELEQLIPHIV